MLGVHLQCELLLKRKGVEAPRGRKGGIDEILRDMSDRGELIDTPDDVTIAQAASATATASDPVGSDADDAGVGEPASDEDVTRE